MPARSRDFLLLGHNVGVTTDSSVPIRALSLGQNYDLYTKPAVPYGK